MDTTNTSRQYFLLQHRKGNIVRFCHLLWGSFMALMLTACIGEETEPEGEGTRVKVGDRWPRFDVCLSDGTPFSTDSLQGRTAMVVFFHTGCPDCRTLLPRLDSLHGIMHRETDFRLVCISREEDATSVHRFWQQEQLSMPVSPQSTNKVYRLFAYTRIPRIYLSTPGGLIRFVHDDRHLPTLKQLQEEVENCRKMVHKIKK